MRIEFIDPFEFLFHSGFRRLNRSLKIKIAAIKYCKNFISYDAKTDVCKQMMTSKKTGKPIQDASFNTIHKIFYSKSNV